MAQLLYERDSTNKHIKAVKRHLRLCTRMGNTDELITQITPYLEALKAKQQVTIEKDELRENASDDVFYEDSLLDNTIRDVFQQCEIYERNNPTEQVIVQIFPEKRYSDIVRMPVADEPNAAEQLALRIEKLGEEHALNAHVAKLRQGIDNARNSIQVYKESIKNVKLAEAEEEIAQADLRRQYENNYLDARKKFGKQTAERLFPKLSNSSRNTIEKGTDDPNN